METGLRIKALRTERDWTTNRLANMCGISQSFLRSVELGQKGISVENLALICHALGITLKQFFDEPSSSDTEDDILLFQLSRLTTEQKRILSAFLATL